MDKIREKKLIFCLFFSSRHYLKIHPRRKEKKHFQLHIRCVIIIIIISICKQTIFVKRVLAITFGTVAPHNFFLSLSIYLTKCFCSIKTNAKKNSRRKTKSIQWWKKKERNVMNMIMMKRLCVVDASRLVWWAQISRVVLKMEFFHVILTLM